MALKINEYSVAPSWWNTEVKKNNGFFTSTSLWAKYYEDLGIATGRYFELLDGKKRVLLVLVYETIIGGPSLLFLPKYVLNSINTIAVFKSFNFHLQPVILFKQSEKTDKEMKRYFEMLIKHFIKLSKNEKKNIMPADLIGFSTPEQAISLCKKMGSDLSLIGTTRLQLKGSAEELYAGMSESVKSGIRKCKKLEVQLKEVGLNEVELFYSNLKQSWEGNHLLVNPLKYYQDLKKDYPENIKYYIALHEGKVVAGTGVMLFGKTMLEFSMYITPHGKTSKVPGGDLLKWELIEFGYRNNYLYLDLNMISVPDAEELEDKVQKINFYKLKWGGDLLYGIKIVRLNAFLKITQQIKLRFLGK